MRHFGHTRSDICQMELPDIESTTQMKPYLDE
jgi:hypothetical protein